MRRANIVKVGCNAASGKLTLGWFVAQTDSLDEAKAQYENHVADYQLAEATQR